MVAFPCVVIATTFAFASVAFAASTCGMEQGRMPSTVLLPPPAASSAEATSAEIAAALTSQGFARSPAYPVHTSDACCTICAETSASALRCIAAMYSAQFRRCYVMEVSTSSSSSSATVLPPVGVPLAGAAARDWTYVVPEDDTDPFARRSVFFRPSFTIFLVTAAFVLLGCVAVVRARRAHMQSALQHRGPESTTRLLPRTNTASESVVASTSNMLVPSYTDFPTGAGEEMNAVPRSASVGHPLFDAFEGAAYTKEFRLLKTLGRGQFGTVYLVKRRGGALQSTPCAMKVVSCATADDISTAFHEFMHLKRLASHPHIVELIDFTLAAEENPPSVSDIGGMVKSPTQRKAPSTRVLSTAAEATRALCKRLNISPSSIVRDDKRAPRRPDGDHVVQAGSPTFVYACILMKYYSEGTLEAAMKSEPEYFSRPATVLSMVTQIARGVAACHALGIAHNDLKPSNVLLCDGRSRAVVSDFGLARTLRGEGASESEANAAAAGTLAYRPPEGVVHREDVQEDAFAADVWALACIAFQLACLNRDVGARRQQPLFHWRAEPDFETSFADILTNICHLPDAGVKVLLRMAAANPLDRPTMAECEALLTVASPPRRATVFFASSGGSVNQ